MSLSIQEVNAKNLEEHNQYILSRQDTTFVDRWEWREVVEKTYNLPHYWYIARNNGKIDGFLGLTLSKHPLFGRYLVTAPFGSQGGFYWESRDAFEGLINQANELQDSLGARYILIRHMEGHTKPPAGWVQDPIYATYHLPLSGDLESYRRETLSSNTRSKINRSLKKGFEIAFGGKNLLNEFWFIINRTMRELGSPYHSRKYLENVVEAFGQSSEIVILYNNRRPIGGGLFVYHLNKLNIVNANFLTQFRTAYAGEYFYWSIILESHQRGIACIDMGRSLVNSGNENAKMKWIPSRLPLAYWYRLLPGIELPRVNQDNPRFQTAIKLWQRMPQFLNNMVGPKLISGIL